MLLPNRDNIERELEEIKNSKPDTYNKIFIVYDFLSGAAEIENPFLFAYEILNELFAVEGYRVAEKSLDSNIPLWFLKTLAGKLLFSAMYGDVENILTVDDVVSLTKTEKKPNGNSRSWVFKSWDEGKGPLKGFKKGYQLFFYESDVLSFLKAKKII